MSQTFDYYFNQLGRIGSDAVDNSQRTLANTRFSNYLVSNYYDEGTSGQHVDFATTQPTIMFSGLAMGRGLNSSVIDSESSLLYQNVNDRPLEKLQLMPRPFLTVPYLGRGACNPTIESQLQQGEMVRDRKSVMNTSPVMDGYTLYCSEPQENKVEEVALQDAFRGGIASRMIAFDKNTEQNHKSFSTHY
jgi:hypothetical protein